MTRYNFLEHSYQASADQVAQGITIAYLLQRHRQQKYVEAATAAAQALSAPDGVPSKSMPSMPGRPVPSKQVPVPGPVRDTPPRVPSKQVPVPGRSVPPNKVPPYPFKARPTLEKLTAIPFKALPIGVKPPPTPKCPPVLYQLPWNNDVHQTIQCPHIKNNGYVVQLSPCRHCCNV